MGSEEAGAYPEIFREEGGGEVWNFFVWMEKFGTFSKKPYQIEKISQKGWLTLKPPIEYAPVKRK